MTVIAWDLKNLVVDGRSTIGPDIVSDRETKLRKLVHPELGPLVAAFCGAMIVIEPWMDHIEENGFTAFEIPDGDVPGEYMTKGIFIKEDGTALEVETNGMYATVDVPSAYGSGQTIAQHYLKSGVDALEAVRQTIKSNMTCGGRLLSYDVETKEIVAYEQ